MITSELKAIQLIGTFKDAIARQGEDGLNKNAIRCSILTVEEVQRQIDKQDIDSTKKALDKVRLELLRLFQLGEIEITAEL